MWSLKFFRILNIREQIKWEGNYLTRGKTVIGKKVWDIIFKEIFWNTACRKLSRHIWLNTFIAIENLKYNIGWKPFLIKFQVVFIIKVIYSVGINTSSTKIFIKLSKHVIYDQRYDNLYTYVQNLWKLFK